MPPQSLFAGKSLADVNRIRCVLVPDACSVPETTMRRAATDRITVPDAIVQVTPDGTGMSLSIR